MEVFFDEKQRINLWSLDASEKLATDEESGKSWSELEEEARKGNKNFSDHFVFF
jgi:hypothetical protein